MRAVGVGGMGKVEREEGWGRAKVDEISDARSSGDAVGQSAFPPLSIMHALVIGFQSQVQTALKVADCSITKDCPRFVYLVITAPT